MSGTLGLRGGVGVGSPEGWLCLPRVSPFPPPPPPPISLLRPLSLPGSLQPSQSSRENFARRLLKPVIRSGQKKALSNPGSQPRGPSNGFRETKEGKIACSPVRPPGGLASRRERGVHGPLRRPRWQPGTEGPLAARSRESQPMAKLKESQSSPLLPRPRPCPRPDGALLAGYLGS